MSTEAQLRHSTDFGPWLEFSNLGLWVLSALLGFWTAPGDAQTARENAQLIDSLTELPVQLGVLAAPQVPADNPQNRRKIEMGAKIVLRQGTFP